MKVGVHIVSYAWPQAPESIPTTLGAIAEKVEEIGCHSLSVMDHYFQMEDFFPVDEEMLEGYTTLGLLAARTQRVQLRTLVTGVTYREPGLLAKIVTTLDVLSGGRGELGIGAAWYEREHRGLGVAFPRPAERFERLEEALQICLQMWSEDNGPYHGKHYQLAETLCFPQPITKPHPPILIGGGGERRTLRLVAKYGDACNLFTPSPEEVAHKLDVLRRHCTDLGRDYDAIEKTILYTGDRLASGDPNGFVEEMREYARLGIEAVFVMPGGPEPVAFLERLAGDPIQRLADM
jgi:F420-dependent oxidoreductase-like protein